MMPPVPAHHSARRVAICRLHIDSTKASEPLWIHINTGSDTPVDIARQYALNRAKANVKLVTNLMNKTRYATLGLNLKFYLYHGMKLTKVNA